MIVPNELERSFRIFKMKCYLIIIEINKIDPLKSDQSVESSPRQQTLEMGHLQGHFRVKYFLCNDLNIYHCRKVHFYDRHLFQKWIEIMVVLIISRLQCMLI